jgi:hypothetical protein
MNARRWTSCCWGCTPAKYSCATVSPIASMPSARADSSHRLQHILGVTLTCEQGPKERLMLDRRVSDSQVDRGAWVSRAVAVVGGRGLQGVRGLRSGLSGPNARSGSCAG